MARRRLRRDPRGDVPGRLGHRGAQDRGRRPDRLAQAGRSRRLDGGARHRLAGQGDFELALTIRTLAVAEGRAHLWVGGGIVWDSDVEAEIEESWVRLGRSYAAVGGSSRHDGAARRRGGRTRSRRPRLRRSSTP